MKSSKTEKIREFHLSTCS